MAGLLLKGVSCVPSKLGSGRELRGASSVYVQLRPLRRLEATCIACQPHPLRPQELGQVIVRLAPAAQLAAAAAHIERHGAVLLHDIGFG